MADPLAALRVPRKSDPAGISDDAVSQEWTKQRWTWVPDEKDGFVAARVQSESGGNATVELVSGQTVTVPSSELQKANPPKFEMVEDMALLTNLNDATVLHNLRDRYYADRIYTYSGLFCVVINPYKKLPIYSDDVIDIYKGAKRQDMPPHVFALTDAAYRDMIEDREDQSILCTGESGAGKTENTKKVIQYLANIAAGGSMRKKGKEAQAEAARRRRSTVGLMVKAAASLEKGELENQLLQANPILETFGNASTIKNDNSSRFGKFIKIHFDASGYIIGASVDTYLLEKSRVVRQNQRERCFHAFYQLLKGAPRELRDEFMLQDLKSYRFLSNGDLELPDDDDSVQFLETNEAFKIMGMDDNEIKDVWKTVAAILAFGQLEWVAARGSDQCNVKSDQPAQQAAHLLGINPADLVKALRTPRLKGLKGEVQVRAQNAQQAEAAVEALCKATYEKLFLWIVERINQSLDRTKGRGGKQFIGILDIAGFEIFEVNSFEQLLINFTNEKLQQLFNRRMFVLEQEEYQKEGIDWTFIDFGLDLQPTIDLIESKMGVLALIEESTILSVSKSTDKDLTHKLESTLSKSFPTQFIKGSLKFKGDFGIKHYAGDVPYTTAEWLVKNKDPINESVEDLLKESGNPFMKTLWTEVSTTRIRGKGGQFRTVGTLYKEQLTHLMNTLNSTTPHFVRCIIPNHRKRPGEIDAPLVLHQLRCNGVLEGIRIVRQGFPSRVLFLDFKQRYSVLTPKSVTKGYEEGKVTVEKMCKELELDPNDFRIGHTKVFFRAGVLAHLEEQRDRKLSAMIVGLQAYCRGHLARKAFKFHVGDHQAVAIIQRNVRIYLKLRDWKWWKLYTRLKPNLKDFQDQQRSKDLNKQIADMTAKLEAAEAEKTALQERVDALTAELAKTKEALELEQETVREMERADQLVQEQLAELTKDHEELEDQFNEELDRNTRLLRDNQKLEEELKALQEDLANKDVDQARVQRLEKEKAELTERLATAEQRATDSEGKVASLSSELKVLKAEIETMQAAKAKADKQARDSQNELADLRREADQLRADATSVQRKIRSFDQQLNDERSKVALVESERDTALAEVRKHQTQVIKLQQELQEHAENAENAEVQRKKAADELALYMESNTVSASSAAALESKIKALEAQVADLDAECDEQHTEISRLKQEKERLAVELHKLQNVDPVEADIPGRERLQRQIKEAMDQLEDERRQRTKIKTEATKLNLDLKSAQEQLDEMTRLRHKDERDKKRLEKKVAVLTEELHTMTMSNTGGGDTERLKNKNRELRRKLEETEDALSAANNAKRRAQLDLEEGNMLIETLEKEIADLRKSLRKSRLDTVTAEATSPRTSRRMLDDSRDVQVERYSDTKYDDDGTVTKITRTIKRTTETHVDEDDA